MSCAKKKEIIITESMESYSMEISVKTFQEIEDETSIKS